MPFPQSLSFEQELIREDSDGWSRSFDDQRQYTDMAYRKERELFWEMVGEMNRDRR